MNLDELEKLAKAATPVAHVVNTNPANTAFIHACSPDNILALIASHRALVAALTEISAFDDAGASKHLAATGSYGAFDEPGAVEVARAALSRLEAPEQSK